MGGLGSSILISDKGAIHVDNWEMTFCDRNRRRHANVILSRVWVSFLSCDWSLCPEGHKNVALEYSRMIVRVFSEKP